MVLSLRKEHHRQQPANMTTIIAILFFAASMANVLLMVSSFPLFHPPSQQKIDNREYSRASI